MTLGSHIVSSRRIYFQIYFLMVSKTHGFKSIFCIKLKLANSYTNNSLR